MSSKFEVRSQFSKPYAFIIVYVLTFSVAFGLFFLINLVEKKKKDSNYTSKFIIKYSPSDENRRKIGDRFIDIVLKDRDILSKSLKDKIVEYIEEIEESSEFDEGKMILKERGFEIYYVNQFFEEMKRCFLEKAEAGKPYNQCHNRLHRRFTSEIYNKYFVGISQSMKYWFENNGYFVSESDNLTVCINGYRAMHERIDKIFKTKSLYENNSDLEIEVLSVINNHRGIIQTISNDDSMYIPVENDNELLWIFLSYIVSALVHTISFKFLAPYIFLTENSN